MKNKRKKSSRHRRNPDTLVDIAPVAASASTPRASGAKQSKLPLFIGLAVLILGGGAVAWVMSRKKNAPSTLPPPAGQVPAGDPLNPNSWNSSLPSISPPGGAGDPLNPNSWNSSLPSVSPPPAPPVRPQGGGRGYSPPPASVSPAAAKLDAIAEAKWNASPVVNPLTMQIPAHWKSAEGATLQTLYQKAKTDPHFYADRMGEKETAHTPSPSTIEHREYKALQAVREGPNSGYGANLPIGTFKYLFTDATGGHWSEGLAYPIAQWMDILAKTGKAPAEDSPLSLAIIWASMHPEATQFSSGDPRVTAGLSNSWAHWTLPERQHFAAVVKDKFTGRG